MYSSIDLVAAKIERQVRRYKEKLRTHKSRAVMPSVSWSHSVVSEVADEVPQEVVAEGPEATAPVPKPMVIKTEKLHANPMSVEEAIMQLNLLHKQFLVFCHSETGAIHVVYRREDESYGLIETTPQMSVEMASPA